jgi:hypothetical protein
MRELRPRFLILAAIACFAALHAASAVDSQSAAGAEPGSPVTFTDIIREIVVSPEGTIFVNFGGKYPKETFAAVVMKETHPRFPDIENWVGKKVLVSGTVSEFEGHKRVILRERGQIKLAESP